MRNGKFALVYAHFRAFLPSDKVGINHKFLGAKTPLKMISDIIRQIWHFAN